MASRYELMTARESNGKTYWTRLGVMFPMQGGKDGFSITLEALPIPQIGNDGKIECRMVAFPPKEQDQRQGGGYGSRASAADVNRPLSNERGGTAGRGGGKPAFDQDIDDEVPF